MEETIPEVLVNYEEIPDSLVIHWHKVYTHKLLDNGERRDKASQIDDKRQITAIFQRWKFFYQFG